MALAPDVAAHRRDLAKLADVAENDLRLILRQFDTADAARDGLRDVLPRLVALYGDAAVALAADWYEDMRDGFEVRGRFEAVAAELPDAGRTNALAGWATGPLFAAEPDWRTTLVKLSGGVQRIIANADRDTIRLSSVNDPRARGWKRQGVGECEFCRLLIGRGAVYTRETADFESHDHCGCVAVPDFT